MITLQQAITQNRETLGAEFENLGSKGKVYLSFDGQTGWSVKKFDGCLGIVQRFLRWMGFYEDTHLKGIAGQVGREADVPAGLLAKINACWQRQGGAPLQAAPAAPAAPVQVAQVAVTLERVDEPKRRYLPQDMEHGKFIGGDTYLAVEIGDITTQRNVKAIVNAANETCLGGGGVDGAIHGAFPRLRAECERLPEIRPDVRCEIGAAVITKSGSDGDVIRVVHAVGPRHDPDRPDVSAARLRNAYFNALVAAQENGVRSIAFPAISTGIFRYPFDEATGIAIRTIEEYVDQNPGHFNLIKLVYTPAMFDQALGIWNQ